MNKDQQEVVDNYIDKYGGVSIKEFKNKVSIRLDYDMILMEGLSYSWLEKFSKCFYDITVGIPDTGELCDSRTIDNIRIDRFPYGMYIILNKFER